MPSSPSEALPFAALPVTPDAADFMTLPVPSVELDLGGSEDLTGQAHGARQQGPSGATIVVEAANAP